MVDAALDIGDAATGFVVVACILAMVVYCVVVASRQ
jgi:hypothetical protein